MKKALTIIASMLLLASCGNGSSSSQSNTSSSSEQTQSASQSSTQSSATQTTSETSSSPSSESSASASESSSSSSEAVKKAQIIIGTLTNASTSLKAGDYEIGKAITFTVTPDAGFAIAEVKLGDDPLTANEGVYTFTPTEEKTYRLQVAVKELDNVAVIDFVGRAEDPNPITKNGIRFAVVGDTQYNDIYKNDQLVLVKDNQFRLVGRVSGLDKDVWIRKIVFDFVSGKDNLTLPNPTTTESYSNGIYESTLTAPDEGDNDICFKATGDVVIKRIVVYTQDHKATTKGIAFTGLDADDKVFYTLGEWGTEAYKARKEYKTNDEFMVGRTYYFVVEAGERHSKYYEIPDALDDTGKPLFTYTFAPDEAHPEKLLKCYRFDVTKSDKEKHTIKFSFMGKDANDSMKIDIESGLKYVKGFMETDPIASSNFDAQIIKYGATVKLTPMAKKGYRNLQVIYNGVPVARTTSEKGEYFEITIADKEENTIAFTAESGDPAGSISIPLAGENQGKGRLLGVVQEGVFQFAFQESDDHPTAQATKITFEGVEVPHTTVSEDLEYFSLTVDQTRKLLSTDESQRPSLFVVTLTEQETYTSTLTFNKGDFTVVVTGKEPTPEEDVPYITYKVDGKSDVTFTITPKEHKDIFAIDANDVRLKEGDYTKNADGSITYTFKALAIEYSFVTQTVNQKVTLTSKVTAGYKIVDLPTTPVDCGTALTLKLAPADDDHYLFGKKITATYDGKSQEVKAAESGDFLFTIVPVKGATEITVVVEDAPLE